MFRSVFTKYVAVFMLIIIVSFVLLSAILVSNTTNNSMNMKKDLIANTQSEITGYVQRQFNNTDTSDFKRFIYFENSGNEISGILSTIASAAGDDFFVIVTAADGRVLLGEREGVGAGLPEAVLFKIKTDGKYAEYTTMSGFFTDKHVVSGGKITGADSEAVGFVLVCTPDIGYQELVSKTVKAIVIAGLWVMFAALVAVYFISDRIIGPIKLMSRAARDFSKGKFDVRIPVTGQDEVTELATAFNNMASALQQNEDMRRTFLANISHDLRTPMTTISGFIEGIQSGAIPPEKQEYYLGIISTEVKRLSRLVSSLLDISRIQAGDKKFVKTNFDICEMARQIIISFEQKLDSKKLDVFFECEHDRMLALADRDSIYQVLYNLCDNAVKFSYEGGKYIVRIIEREKKIFVSVYNSGQGIQQQELPFVFDRFYKSDKSRGLDKTGVGLGLYIVKTIIDGHGEDIWVRSKYGEYCEFVFTLSPGTEEGVVK